MRTEQTKEERDVQAQHERQITRVAATSRQFLNDYDEFFPEDPYAISDSLQNLCEATNALAIDEVGTIRLQVMSADGESWGVVIVDAHGTFRYWLEINMTFEGVCATITEAELYFASLGLKVICESVS